MSWIINDLNYEINVNRLHLEELVHGNLFQVYSELNKIFSKVGNKYNIQILINFLSSNHILEVEKYGSRNISIIIDNSKRKFNYLLQENIENKITKLNSEVSLQPAFRYEGRDGLRINVKGGRIDILPGAIHLWCIIDEEINSFLDWIFMEEYKKFKS